MAIHLLYEEKKNENVVKEDIDKDSIIENIRYKEHLLKNERYMENSITEGSIKGNQATDDNPTRLLNTSSGDLASNIISPRAECIFKAPDGSIYQSIQVTEFPFFIGKLQKKVDYCLSQDTVSRYHAKLLKEGDCYFIMDMNSTNGTFVNGDGLGVYEKRQIRQGDEIRFANISYRLEISEKMLD